VARREHQLEGQAGGVGGHQHGLLVDRHDPLAQPHLLCNEVAEQALTHRARRVCAGALALTRDRRRHEAERVQLRVRVRQRGTGLALLVDDQLHIRALGVRAHPLAPDIDREDHLLEGELGERHHGLGSIDDHLVRARRRHRHEQLSATIALSAYQRLRLVLALVLAVLLTRSSERRVEVPYDAHPPARGVRRAAARAHRV
jgi:hypothetical protein